MSFATIGLLVAGAVSMAVPIIIHLLARQRRRPIEWAAMRFLIEALRKHRQRIRLEQFLLLLARCLVLFILGAALARPILEQAGVFDAGGLATSKPTSRSARSSCRAVSRQSRGINPQRPPARS